MLGALLFYLNLKKAYSNALKLSFKQGEAEASFVIRIVILQQAHYTTLKKKRKRKNELYSKPLTLSIQRGLKSWLYSRIVIYFTVM